MSQEPSEYSHSPEPSPLGLSPVTIQRKFAGEFVDGGHGMVLRTAVSPVVGTQESRAVDLSSGNMSLDRSRSLPPMSPLLRRVQRVVGPGVRSDPYEQTASREASSQRSMRTFSSTDVLSETRASATMLTRSTSREEFPLVQSISATEAMGPLEWTTPQAHRGTQASAIVWRRSLPNSVTDDHVSGSVSHASFPFLARQAATSIVSPATQPGPGFMNDVPVPTEMSQPVNSANIAEMADQVSRFLTRRLSVERERRGIGA